jgi:hypothetical protein
MPSQLCGRRWKTAFPLTALPEKVRELALVRVRSAHEEPLREHGCDPALDPRKTYIDLIMNGIELLLIELGNTGQKEN